MHENALQRVGGNVMGAPPPSSERFVQLGVDRPRIAFSEVMSFDMNGEAIHIVHQQPAYSNADALTHFHVANLLYFGEVFPGDGYPMIDFAQGGKLDGSLKMLGGWTTSKLKIVPARGEVTDGTALKAFCDMLIAVRDRVQNLIDAHHSESENVAEHPTAEFEPDLTLETEHSPVSALDQAFLNHLLITQPQVRDIRRAEAQNVFQRPACVSMPKVHTDPFEQFDERLRSFRKCRPRMCIFRLWIQPVIGDHVQRRRPAAVANDP